LTYDPDIEVLGWGRATALATLAAVAATLLAMSPILIISPVLIPLVVIVAFVIAFAHAFFVGLPVYLLLRRYWTLRWWNAIIGGSLVAVVPAMLLTDLDRESGILLCLGLIGASGGLVFWRSMHTVVQATGR
jgi:hypothetical protein